MELVAGYLRDSEDIEVLQLLLLIVAIAALKKPELTTDVRNLQIIPTEGGKLVSLTAEEVMLSACVESKAPVGHTGAAFYEQVIFGHHICISVSLLAASKIGSTPDRSSQSVKRVQQTLIKHLCSRITNQPVECIHRTRFSKLPM